MSGRIARQGWNPPPLLVQLVPSPYNFPPFRFHSSSLTAELCRQALDLRMPPKEVLLKLEGEKAWVKFTGDKHETLGWGWGGEGVAGTLSLGSQTTPRPMYSMGGKKFVDIAGGRRHTLLVSEEVRAFCCCFVARTFLPRFKPNPTPYSHFPSRFTACSPL